MSCKFGALTCKKRGERLKISNKMKAKQQKDEAQMLYDIISQRFMTHVQSVDQADQVFETFVNEYNNAKAELQRIPNYESNIKLLQQKLKRTTKRIEFLENQLITTNKYAEQAKRNEQQQKDTAEQCKLKIIRLESTIDHLKQQLSIVSEPANCNNVQNPAPDMLEGLLLDQNKEITSLSLQREKIIKLFHNFEELVEKSEQSIQTLQTKNNNLEEKYAALQEKFDNTTKDQNRMMQTVDDLLCDEVKNMVDHNNYNDLKGFVEEVVKVTNDLAKSKKSANSSFCKSFKCDDELYIQILTRLEDAMRYILYGEKSSDDPLIKDDNCKARLVKECSRISKFIDEKLFGLDISDIPQHLSMFSPDAFTSVEQQLKELFKYGEKSIMNSAQVRMLFVLFSVICIVNKKLSDKITDMTETVKIAEGLTNQSNIIKQLSDENNKLKKSLEEQKQNEKREKDQKQKEIQKDQNQAVENEKLTEEIKKNEELNDKIASLEDKIKEMTIEKNNLEEKSQEHVTNHKIDNAIVTQQMEDLKNKNEELLKTLKDVKDNAAKCVKQASKKILALESQISKQNSRVKEMENGIDILAEDNKKMTEQIETQKAENISQAKEIQNMSQKISDLEQKKNRLREKLQNHQMSSSNEISSLKKELEAMRSEHISQVGKLNNDILIEKNVQQTMQSTIDKLLEQKKSLVEANTKVTLSEKSLRLKILQMEEQHKHELNNVEAKSNIVVSSIKSQYSSQITAITEELNSAKNSLIELLNLTEKDKVCSLKDLIDSVKMIFTQYEKDRPILNDAKQVKVHLKLKNDEQILASIKKLEDKFASLSDELDNSKIVNEEIKAKMSKQTDAESEVFDLKADIKAWECWSRSLYMQIAQKGIPKNMTVVKNTIEEAVIGSTSETYMRKKLNLLRAEKEILSNGMIPKQNDDDNENKKPTIRTIIASISFIRRVQMLVMSSTD